MLRGRAHLARRLHQRQRVLGKAGAAEAGAGMQELAADAAVQADAARHILHIAADLLAQARHLVDEGDLGGEKGIGGIFDQLAGLAAGEQRSASR